MSRDEKLEELGLDFSADEVARETMIEYIRENFSDVLGDRINLLDAENGLDLLLQEVERMKREEGISVTEQVRAA
ncbi:MAG: hypothetical protein ABEJ65_05430 [bacterium]